MIHYIGALKIEYKVVFKVFLDNAHLTGQLQCIKYIGIYYLEIQRYATRIKAILLKCSISLFCKIGRQRVDPYSREYFIKKVA